MAATDGDRIVSGVRTAKAGGVGRVETTVSMPSGLTGGGLFDAHGELIGVLAATRAGDTHGLALRILNPRDIAENDAIMRAIAAHEPFDTPVARIDATERYLSQMVSQTDQTKRRAETQL